MEDLHKLMLEWTRLDKELKDVNYQASQIRKKKDELQKHLCPLIQDNQLEDNIFSVPSLQTNVTFKEQKTSESISYKFLEEKFTENGYTTFLESLDNKADIVSKEGDTDNTILLSPEVQDKLRLRANGASSFECAGIE